MELLDVARWISENIYVVYRYIIASVVVVASYYLAKYLSSQVTKLKIEAPPEVIHNIARTVRATVFVVGTLVALSIAGVDLSGAVVAAGFAGLVIGLAAQQTLSNFFSGLALIVEGRVKVGDSIRLGDDWGLVESVGIMTTQIRLWSGEILTLPNSSVMSSPIYNFSRSVARRGDFTIGISYGSDIGKAIEIIRSVLWSNELVLAEPEPVVIVDSLGESSVNLKVLFWVPSQEFWTVRKEIIRDVKKALEEAGIEIPFPQRVVWLRDLSMRSTSSS